MPKKDDDTIAMLESHDFVQLEKLANVDSTLAGNAYTYDRIFIKCNKCFEIIEDENGLENGGAVEFRSLFEANLST